MVANVVYAMVAKRLISQTEDKQNDHGMNVTNVV